MLKDTVREKLGDDFDITKSKKKKPKIIEKNLRKIKIINDSKEKRNLKNENLIDTILKQNEINGKEEGFYIIPCP